MLALSLVLGNGAYLFFSHEEKARLAVRRMAMLHVPTAALDPDRQALYWAYALYDYDKLVHEFGVPRAAIVDFGFASTRLNDLLPRISPSTRMAIEQYHPRLESRP